MGIVLRLDIDKPFGRASLPAKVLSKIREDYHFPAWDRLGYLKDLGDFLAHLNELKIRAISYHRLCTAPNPRVKDLLNRGGHLFGLHAEDTRSMVTLADELKRLSRDAGMPIHSFTKHGSGELKLGRRHYAPYEPQKYLDWARQLGVPFLFGNGIAKSSAAFSGRQEFYPDMFWLEPGYQAPEFSAVDQALDAAEQGTLVLIIHPENLKAIGKVAGDFEQIRRKAKDRGIPFVTDSTH